MFAQISYADTLAELSAVKDGRRVYPRFFRVVPGDNEHNPARVALLRSRNWNRIGILTQGPVAKLPRDERGTDRYTYVRAQLSL